MENIEAIVREFILDDLLHGEDASALTNSTQLISDRVLDSIAILRLAVFLEERFDIDFEPHEIGVEELDTIDMIVNFVRARL